MLLCSLLVFWQSLAVAFETETALIRRPFECFGGGMAGGEVNNKPFTGL